VTPAPGPSPTRPVVLRVAVVLLLVEGLSGIGVGGTLLAGLAGLTGVGGAIAIPIGILAYGLILVLGAFGILGRRAWGSRLAGVALVGGLTLLVVLLAIAGWDDAVLWGAS
jgi:hypothetical protein